LGQREILPRKLKTVRSVKVREIPILQKEKKGGPKRITEIEKKNGVSRLVKVHHSLPHLNRKKKGYQGFPKKEKAVYNIVSKREKKPQQKRKKKRREVRVSGGGGECTFREGRCL